MWVSILQNGRKKDVEGLHSKHQPYPNIADKSYLSTSLTKSSFMYSSRLQDKHDSMKEKQNNINSSARLLVKNRHNLSTPSQLANRSNILSPSYNNSLYQDKQNSKTFHRAVQEHIFSITKARKQQQNNENHKQNQNNSSKLFTQQDQKSLYFFRILAKKNKLRNQFNMNIHNSIFTFKQFMKICQLAPAKPIDLRIAAQTQNNKRPQNNSFRYGLNTNTHKLVYYTKLLDQSRVGYGFVQVRPYCKQILKKLSQHFDIIIFTASTQAYADPIIDHIDPDNVVKHRLYRQSCSFVKNQIFVKDLRVLGRSLSNVVLVDNAPYSYLMQLDNAIPIIPYYRGKDDEELISLQKYLMKLKDIQDVRIINKEYFKLHQYVKFDSHQKLVAKLYKDYKK